MNSLLGPLFDELQAPLAGLPAWFGVLLWSIPLGAFALLVFKWTSNQARIAEVKRHIAAGLFEIRLFNDDLRAIIRAQGEILRHVITYQGLALKPMVFILPPLVLVMVQLHAFYGFRSPSPDETVLVRVAVNSADTRPDLEIEVPQGVVIESPGVWAAELGELVWRLRVEQDGDHQLRLVSDAGEWSKSLRTSDRIVRLSPTRPGTGFLDQLEWPSEPPLPADSPVAEITVDYPDARFDAVVTTSEWRYAWMVVFFVLTMVVALALKRPLHVEL